MNISHMAPPGLNSRNSILVTAYGLQHRCMPSQMHNHLLLHKAHVSALEKPLEVAKGYILLCTNALPMQVC